MLLGKPRFPYAGSFSNATVLVAVLYDYLYESQLPLAYLSHA